MKSILYILLLFFTLSANAQKTESSTDDSLHTDVHAAFVVITPGNTPASLMGHIAIRMWCPSAGLDYCFTGKTPDWGNEFVTAVFKRVKLGIVPEETKMFREDYRCQGRGITEYELELTLQEKQKLWMLLDKEVTKGLVYDMDYIHHGCAIIATNMILAAISDRHIDLTTVIDKYVYGNTRREILLRYNNFYTWEEFIGHSIFGGSLDKEVTGDEKLIMPEDVITVFDAANIIHGKNVICRPTVKAADDIYISPLMFALLFFALCCIRIPILDYPIMALHTLIGAFLCAVVFVSIAPGTEWNWLIILFNPAVSILYWSHNKKIHWILGIIIMNLLLFMIYKINSIFCLSQILIVGGYLIKEIYKIFNLTQN
ncbi:MAG: DUF4105 domain-containing protein [Bacteroidaceae bacterium]|nr:DUF4105 domain-containing protein [Bacteroidaceae bacterium]